MNSMDEINRQERIEAYLKGQLNAQEKAAFEANLQQDPELQAEVAMHRKVQEYLGQPNLQAMRAKLQQVDQSWQAPNSQPAAKVRRLQTGWIMGLAAALLVVMLAIWWVFAKNQPGTDELLAEFQAPYPMILNQRSGNEASAIQQAANQAIIAYQNNDFKAAQAQFEQLFQQSRNQTFAFYAAIAALQNQDAQYAIERLSPLVDKTPHLLQEQSRWYLALAYLANDQPLEAQKVLNQISEGNYRYEQAQQLRTRLSGLLE